MRQTIKNKEEINRGTAERAGAAYTAPCNWL